MYIHLFLAAHRVQTGNQALNESLRIFCCLFYGQVWHIPTTSYQYTVEGVVTSTTDISAATEVVSFYFTENLSLVLASSGDSQLIFYSTCIWGVCECKAAQMNEWINTPTAGEYNLLQNWERFPGEKVGGGIAVVEHLWANR